MRSPCGLRAAILLCLAEAARIQAGPTIRDVPRPVVSWKDSGSVRSIGAGSAVASLSNGTLSVSFSATWSPWITIPVGGIDLGDRVGLAVPVTNTGREDLILRGTLDNKGLVSGIVVVPPGRTDTLGIVFRRSASSKPAYIDALLPGLAGLPGGFNSASTFVDPSRLQSLKIFVLEATSAKTFLLGDVYGWGAFSYPSEASLGPGGTFHPFIDSFGQFRHEDWEGKTRTESQMTAEGTAEGLELDRWGILPDRDAYGGWSAGPTLRATGHFRTEKVGGKWWFVTPEGHLFWSFGTDVAFGAGTIVGDGTRASWFREVPAGASAAPFHGSVGGKATFDFGSWNLLRKYGSEWRDKFRERTHRRFLGWGMNSYAGWSDASFATSTLKMPYFSIAYLWPQDIDVSDSAAFRAKIAALLGPSASKLDADPWCVGVFVGNELGWSAVGGDSLAEVAGDFYRIVSEEFRRAMPHKLYLGDRHSWVPATVVDSASKYCDVVSGNWYVYSPRNFVPKSASRDKPYIVGEFHFGAIESGVFGAGLCAAASQRHKGQSMEAYYRDLLADSSVVGGHWFTYRDQMATARPGDAENFGFGFVDIADRPYPEMVAAARRVGENLYRARSNGSWSVPTTSSPKRAKAGASIRIVPRARVLEIRSSLHDPLMAISVTTLSGRRIVEVDLSSAGRFELNTSDWSEGAYFVEARTPQGSKRVAFTLVR